jgi:hypothetical protein
MNNIFYIVGVVVGAGGRKRRSVEHSRQVRRRPIELRT